MHWWAVHNACSLPPPTLLHVYIYLSQSGNTPLLRAIQNHKSLDFMQHFIRDLSFNRLLSRNTVSGLSLSYLVLCSTVHIFEAFCFGQSKGSLTNTSLITLQSHYLNIPTMHHVRKLRVTHHT